MTKHHFLSSIVEIQEISQIHFGIEQRTEMMRKTWEDGDKYAQLS